MKLIDAESIKFAASVTMIDMCKDPRYNDFEKELIIKLSDMVTTVADVCEPVDAIPTDWILNQIDSEDGEEHRGSYERLIQKWRADNPIF